MKMLQPPSVQGRVFPEPRPMCSQGSTGRGSARHCLPWTGQAHPRGKRPWELLRQSKPGAGGAQAQEHARSRYLGGHGRYRKQERTARSSRGSSRSFSIQARAVHGAAEPENVRQPHVLLESRGREGGAKLDTGQRTPTALRATSPLPHVSHEPSWTPWHIPLPGLWPGKSPACHPTRSQRALHCRLRPQQSPASSQGAPGQGRARPGHQTRSLCWPHCCLPGSVSAAAPGRAQSKYPWAGAPQLPYHCTGHLAFVLLPLLSPLAGAEGSPSQATSPKSSLQVQLLLQHRDLCQRPPQGHPPLLGAMHKPKAV